LTGEGDPPGRPRTTATTQALKIHRAGGTMRIIGIDPGSSATGFGVVEGSGSRIAHVAHGVVRTNSGWSLADRLAEIHRGLGEVLAQYRPEMAVIEQVFVALNPRSAVVLGQARGAALVALSGACIPVAEISSREVKKAVTGSGAAGKADVQAMVVRLLGLSEIPPSDAADALAMAICRVRAGRLVDLGVRPRSRRRTRSNIVLGRPVL
jgi:crossover junction endodeoxyribonuclease RuvC